MAASDAELTSGDVTPQQVQKSISRQRLVKWSTVSLGEKIRLKLEKRKESTGRRVNRRRNLDAFVTEAVSTLTSLKGAKLVDVVRRGARLLEGGDPIEWQRLSQSQESVDRALFFLDRLSRSWSYCEALRKNQEAYKQFSLWLSTADRIAAKDGHIAQRKHAQKLATEKKIRSQRHSARQS